MEHLGHDFNAEARDEAKRAELKEERREVLEQWFDTELRRFVNAMDMGNDAYEVIRDAILETAHDEKVI